MSPDTIVKNAMNLEDNRIDIWIIAYTGAYTKNTDK
jgi:hypothetical protein